MHHLRASADRSPTPLLPPPDAPIGDADRALRSVCLIVRDEESGLPRCLAPLEDVVDEVVVHHTGSVDRAVAIATTAPSPRPQHILVGTLTRTTDRARSAAFAEALEGRSASEQAEVPNAG